MPTIIDSLVIELGFDAEGMEAGRKKVEDAFNKTQQGAKKTGKDIEDSTKTAGEFLTRLRNNVLSLFAAFTAGRGVKDFVAEMTTSNAALGRFAKTLGMSSKELATWRAAGKLMGVDAKDIDSTFSGLTQQFQQFSITGDSSIVPWFRALGINLSDANGKMVPMSDTLMKLAERFKGMDPAKAVAFMNGMGIAPGMQNILLAGPEAFKKLLDSQKALAEAQARDAPAAAERQKAWENFKNQAEAVGIVLLQTLTPAIISLTNAAKAFAEWGQEHPNIVGAAFAALTAVVLALSAAITVTLVAGAVGAAVAGFGALLGVGVTLATGMAALTATVLPGLSAAFYTLAGAIYLTPIGWVVAGIAAISAAGFLLVKYWDDIAKWWKNLWGGMSDDAEEGSNKTVDSINKVKNTKDSKATGSSSGPVAIPSGPQAESDIKKLMQMGWTREQATGIVANITAESAGKTDAVGDGGRAFGLAQWHPDRQADFKKWAGKDIRQATRDEQLAFINYELREGKEKKAGYILQQTTTAEHAARAINTHYERPADIAGQNATRAAIANALLRAPASAAPPNLAASTATGGNKTSFHRSTSDTRIGEVKVYTQATDAKGIARDIKPALARDTFAQQANYGPA